MNIFDRDIPEDDGDWGETDFELSDLGDDDELEDDDFIIDLDDEDVPSEEWENEDLAEIFPSSYDDDDENESFVDNEDE